MKIHFHEGDLPAGVDFGKSVAIDTETLGLNPQRDALCLAQLSGGDGHCHIVRFDRKTYAAPNLVRLLSDPEVVKIFHYARFDVGVFQKHLKTDTTPVWCTKIASKLVRTYTDRHGLKDLVKELLDVDLSKQQQSSDWGAAKLERGAARLCGVGCFASAQAQSDARCDAGAGGAPGARPQVLRRSSAPGRP